MGTLKRGILPDSKNSGDKAADVIQFVQITKQDSKTHYKCNVKGFPRKKNCWSSAHLCLLQQTCRVAILFFRFGIGEAYL